MYTTDPRYWTATPRPNHTLPIALRHSLVCAQVLETSARPQSAWAYIRSGVWARPLAAVAALYLFLVLMLVVMIKRLPTRDALSEKAQLPADTLLLLKLVHPFPQFMIAHTNIMISPIKLYLPS